MSSQPLTSLRRNKGSEFSRMIKEAKHLGLALGIPCLDGKAVIHQFRCFSIWGKPARTVCGDVFIGGGGYVICYEMEDIEKLHFGRKSLVCCNDLSSSS